MQKGLAQASYSAVTGDLLATNGLINCVKGGVYASGTGFSVRQATLYIHSIELIHPS